jgi:sigma-B regulation protein RsbU (phosphoserine phosphatase)
MNFTRVEQIQVLYEIALAIGEELDLDKMLAKSLRAFLRRLNCLAGGIIFFTENPSHSFTPELIRSIPKNLKSLKTYQEAIKEIPPNLTSSEKTDLHEKLPWTSQTSTGKNCYFFDLKPWGVLLLIKSSTPLEKTIIDSLPPLARKLASAIGACMTNKDLYASWENLAKAQNDLGMSEARLQAILDTAPDAIVSMDLDFRITSFNPAAEKLFGYRAEEVLNRPFDFLLAPEHEKETIDKYETGRRKDGGTFPFELSMGQVSLGGRAIITGFLRDATARKKWENALAKQAHDLTERVKEINCLFSISKLFNEKEKNTEQILKKVVRLIPPAWQHPRETCAMITYQGDKFATDNFIETSWRLESPILIQGKQVGAIKVCYRNELPLCDHGPFLHEETILMQTISDLLSTFLEQIQAQDLVRRTEKRYRHLFESMGDFLVVHDLKGRILDVNPMVTKSLGYTEQEMVGTLVSDFIPRAYRNLFKENYLPAIRSRKTVSGTMYLEGKDGVTHTIEYKNSLTEQEDGTVSISGVGRDVTDRLKAEKKLAQARERELSIGSHIQRELLLGRLPGLLDGARVSVLTIPSEGIDGDFFNFIQHSDRCFDFIIGDIMGKGVAAALLGAAAKSQFERAFSFLAGKTITRNLPPIQDIVTYANQLMVQKLMDLESFITLCYARVDLEKRTLEMVDCGHTRLLHHKKGKNKANLVQGHNMPLGFSKDDEFLPVILPISTGDTLLFYSDGITEAENPKGEFFGEERLGQLLTQGSLMGTRELVEMIRKKVILFRKSETISDDLTCMALRIHQPDPPLVRNQRVFPARLDALIKMRQFLRITFTDSVAPGLGKEGLYQLELAAHETCANVVKHAYKNQDKQNFTMLAEAFPCRLVVKINHQGKVFDPTTVAPPPLDGSKDSGFGLYLIQRSVDAIEHKKDDQGNWIILTKYPTLDKVIHEG